MEGGPFFLMATLAGLLERFRWKAGHQKGKAHPSSSEEGRGTED
jgi:hypothetical protein